MTAPPPVETPTNARAPEVGAAALLAVVEGTLRDLHPGAADLPPVAPASMLDQDLGFDSLARMELLLRTERAFGVDLPAETLQRAETVADLWSAVQQGLARGGTATTSTTNATAARTPHPPDMHGLPTASAGLDNGEPSEATTLLQVLDWHLAAHPEQTQVVVLGEGGEMDEDAEQSISYRQLAQASAAVAAGLQRAGVVPRQGVAIMLPTCADYFSTYFGILRAGAIPVPIYPPARASQLEDHVLRHTGILSNAQAVLMVTVPEAMPVARLLQARVPGLRHVLTHEQLALHGQEPESVSVRGDDIAFIQYTSGSTGNPKGVALTHANLLANMRAMAHGIKATPRDVFVSWLPLYHDMGLIGAWLAPMYVGFPLVVMSPLHFLARPLRWLQAVHRWRGTLSAGPNFAYELCLKRVADADLAGLDLSCWRLAFNGAEAVSPDTVRRFSERFAACGLAPEAMAPVYGLAECSVGLLFPPLGRVAPIDSIQREPFTRERRAVPAETGDATALHFAACGSPLPGHAVRLVGDDGQEVPERTEGRLWFRGPSATHGYYRNPEQTATLFHDGWLDSGDRAYRAGADIFVTGRVKDIVIRGGRNLYPQEIEEAVGQVEGVRKGCVAVFGRPDPATGTERLVVLAEARPAPEANRAALRDAVAKAVVAAIGEPPDEVVLAPPHTVLKTSSGKVRRSACRALVESGAIGSAAPSAARQWLRLARGAAALRLRTGVAVAGRALYGAWAMSWFLPTATVTWLLTALTQHPATAWRMGRAATRALLRVIGIPLSVQGLQHLPAGPCVLVSNHGSYLDGVILVAALPRPFVFVAKRELRRQFVAGTYLRRLGTEFVERFEARQSVVDAERLADVARQGRSLAVFPEGTFIARPGLLPFHLGAFMAAARAGVPVLPVVIRGHRELLPAGRWWPRRAALQVTVLDAIAPPAESDDLFAGAARLREAARRVIAAGLESPAAGPDATDGA